MSSFALGYNDFVHKDSAFCESPVCVNPVFCFVLLCVLLTFLGCDTGEAVFPFCLRAFHERVSCPCLFVFVFVSRENPQNPKLFSADPGYFSCPDIMIDLGRVKCERRFFFV